MLYKANKWGHNYLNDKINWRSGRYGKYNTPLIAQDA